VFPVSSWTAAGRHVPETGLRARLHHQHHGSYAPGQLERHETPDPGRSDAVNPGFQYVRQASGRRARLPGRRRGRRAGPAFRSPPLLDRLLRPFNRLGTQRFLREARVKVWANAITLNRARRQGPAAYAARLAQLEELSAAKVADLQAPGQVLLKLAATGFGVRLPG
jgi:hypothetical protein